MNKLLDRLKIKDSRGMVFITVLFIGILLTFAGLSLANVALAQLKRTTDNVFISNALLTAEAGIEASIREITEDGEFIGFTEDEGEFYNNTEQGRGTYETSVTDGTGPNEKVITSIGRAYDRSGNLAKERRVRVTIVPTESPGYSVSAGPGGLIMDNGRILNASVQVNGKITMSNSGSVGIGTVAQPLNINVANADCGTGDAYPEQCTSGQAITIQNNGSNNMIVGTICATHQTQTKFPVGGSNTQITGGSTGEGLKPACVAPVQPVPTYDRVAHIAKMTTTTASNNITYNCSQWLNPVGFTRTWPANIRINGSFSTNNCDLTISGDVYITGDFSFAAAGQIRVADSVGTTMPVVVVDGAITTNSSTVIPNSSGTGIRFISYKTNAACNPNCTSLTGSQLKTSQSLETVTIGGNTGNLNAAIFQSHWGRIHITGSGNVGSALGQSVRMSGSGTINFGTGLAMGSTGWAIRSYQYDYE